MISLSPRSSPPRRIMHLAGLTSTSLPSSPISLSLGLPSNNYSTFSSTLFSTDAATTSFFSPSSSTDSLPLTTKALRHATFWFLDGTLILRIFDSATGIWRLFRVHRDLIHRHSLVIPRLDALSVIVDEAKCEGVDCPAGVVAEDVETLLEHLYHDIPLSSESSFNRLASALRVSSPKQLDFPAIHRLAREYIERMFPSGSRPFYHPDCLEAALALSMEFGITKVQKGLFYSLVTTSAFTPSDDTTPPTSPTSVTSHAPATTAPPLSSADSNRLNMLMKHMIHHFTPILFTPPGAGHMACTDALASAWMPKVIQPALLNDGVYKPLETLERMKLVDWVSVGVCRECVDEKVIEWETVQDEVWEAVGGWLDL